MIRKRICAWHPLYFGVPFVMQEGDEPATHGCCNRCISRLELERVRAIAQPYVAGEYTSQDEVELALKVNGQIIDTGGNITVILLRLKHGDVIGISEECICLYEAGSPEESAEDVFWNHEASATEYV